MWPCHHLVRSQPHTKIAGMSNLLQFCKNMGPTKRKLSRYAADMQSWKFMSKLRNHHSISNLKTFHPGAPCHRSSGWISSELEVKWEFQSWRPISPITSPSHYIPFQYMGVSKNRGTPKSSILIGFSIVNHPFWGTLTFGNTHMAFLFFFNLPFKTFY